MATKEDMRGKIIDLANAVGYADGSIVSKTLLDKKTGTLTLFSFDAGQGLSEHTSPFDATVYILDGEAEITVKGEKMTVTTGDFIIMPCDIPHDVQAKQRFKMLLIMIR